MDNLLFKIEVQGLTEQVKELGRLKTELSSLKDEEKNLNKEFKEGKISADQYNREIGTLGLKITALKAETSALSKETQAQATAFKGAEGSMVRLGQELAMNRDRYRALSQAERENAEVGGKLLTTIQAQDTQIKKLDATIGNHQRNVGNYPGLMGLMGSSISSNIPIVGAAAGALSAMSGKISSATGSTDGLSKGMMIAGGAILIGVAAFGKLYSAISDGVKMLIKEEERVNMLTFALEGNSRAASEMIEFAKTMSGTSLFKKGDILDAENLALSMGRNEAQTKKVIEAAMGLSRALGIDLRTATQQISATYEGQIGRMGKLEGNLKNLTKEELAGGAAVDLLYEKYARFGKEGLDTIAGKLEIADKKMAAFHKDIASTWMPIISRATSAWADFWTWVAGGSKKAEASTFMGDLLKAQQNALQSATKSEQDVIISTNEARAASYLKLWKAATDPSMRAQYAKNYDEQLEINEKLRKQRDELNSKGDFVDKDAGKAEADKAKAAAEKAQQEYEKGIKTRQDAIKSNNAYLIQLSAKAIDDQIAAMSDGIEKEKAASNDRYNDSRVAALNAQAEKITIIDAEIKIIADKGKKATADELKQVKELNAQKISIIEATDTAVVAMKERNTAELYEIDKKYSKSAEDEKITSKYGQDVARVTEEGQLKLTILREFYASKGTLTKDEETKLKDEELKLAIEVAQKKYDLLYAEIQARKSLGVITQEEYDEQLKNIARLYGEVKKLGGDQESNNGTEKKKPDGITGGIMDMFNIDEGQAGQIKNKASQLIGQLQGMWISAQENRIKTELKNETAKVDRIHDANVKSLDEQRRKGLITEKQYNEKKDKLDKEAAKKKDDLNREAFEKNKRLQLLNAVINGAMAVIAAAMTPVIGVVMAVLAGIMVAAQIATIASTKYEGARGGMLRGPSHAQGGIKYAMGGDILELEGGEAVLNKRAMESQDVMTLSGTPRQIASRVNSYRGWGTEFAAGGFTPAPNPIRASSFPGGQSGLTESITAALSAQKVYVLESEITETQGKAKKITVESVW